MHLADAIVHLRLGPLLDLSHLHFPLPTSTRLRLNVFTIARNGVPQGLQSQVLSVYSQFPVPMAHDQCNKMRSCLTLPVFLPSLGLAPLTCRADS